MNRTRLFALALPLILAACTSADNTGTIAQLRNRRIEIKEEKIEGGLEKAMASYQRFLEETPDSALAPEAIRRLADLKVEREYGHISGGVESTDRAAATMTAPKAAPQPVFAPLDQAAASASSDQESEADFEKRTTVSGSIPGSDTAAGQPLPGADDLERAGAVEAVALYQKLLKEYPLYERNDQVLYQMSRAYEELGRIDEAMAVMDSLVREYPNSRYMDEVQFRRAEYYFTHRRYLDAEDAYKSIVDIGVGSTYFQLALYKLGWTFYKQELYDEALDRFIALLDYKVSVGYDFAQTEDETESKRMEDTFRVISLGFSNLGGAKVVVDYFARHGKRSYEHRVYSNLGEYYYDKRRFSDATETYNAFVSRNLFHEVSPNFHMRVIEINIAGGFPTLVIDSKKEFAKNYGLNAEYWQHFEPSARPEVLGFLKTNLKDLANHYHSLYQDKRRAEEKSVNFAEALHWYREFLTSFPQDVESPAINYQLAALLLENRSFAEAAVEYERTAYDYPHHEKSSEAGYAAVYAYRQHLGVVKPEKQEPVKREVVRSSLKFAEAFPEHEKAAIVLGAAADDLDEMGDYEQALTAAQKLIKIFPGADKEVLRGAWLVVAHSSFELLHYSEAEAAYVKVLALLPEGDKTRSALVDNLAISIYKQGEQAKVSENYRAAADHFLRVGVMAPTSKFRPNAEYDAAAALILLKDWQMAATVLSGFRDKFPGHELQPEVTKKIAYVYKEDGKLSLAAAEYERIEKESRDEEVRREALLIAAELYGEADDNDHALDVYRRYVGFFPHPVESNLETRNKIAVILKAKNDQDNYLAELGQMVTIEAAAGSERTPRTRYLAGKAALVLAELSFDRFAEVKLVKPFEVNLRKKKELMKTATQQFGKLYDYEVGEVTAATTFYLAEIYAHFSKALMSSERPEGLNPLELEQYELAIEEQAYPFEEKAISVHESNLELISLGIYNEWVDKSLRKLAKFVPARYDKPEEESGIIASLDTYTFATVLPEPPAPPVSETGAVVAAAEPVLVAEPAEADEETTAMATAEVEEPKQGAKPADAEKVKAEVPQQTAKSGQDKGPVKVEEPENIAKPDQVQKAVKAEEQKLVVKSSEAEEMIKAEAPPQAAKQIETKEPAKADESNQDAKSVDTKTLAEAEEELRPAAKPGQDNESVKVEEPVKIAKPDQVLEVVKDEAPPQAAKQAETKEPAKGDEPKQVAKSVDTKTPAEAGELKPAVKPEQDNESVKVEEPKNIAKPDQVQKAVKAEEQKLVVKSAEAEEVIKAEATPQVTKQAETQKTDKTDEPKQVAKPVDAKAPAKAEESKQAEKSDRVEETAKVEKPAQTEESEQKTHDDAEKVAMPDTAVQ